MQKYFREAIDKLDGYTPGEQPRRVGGWIKLNTNENPYPPSPLAAKALQEADPAALRLYPDPECCELRKAIAVVYGLKPGNVLVGNGSDDILTIATRCFVGDGETLSALEPSYSLYPVLAAIQGAKCRAIPLENDFSLPADFAGRVSASRMVLLARPNAPTGNCFPKEEVSKFCADFPGIVLIDEAYADFADDNCVDLVPEHPNILICRTLSKSYSLAGLRLGFVLGSEGLISGMMKVKDSYNVGLLPQLIATAALGDREYLAESVMKIRGTRESLSSALSELGFQVVPSQANFIFASPPRGDAERLYRDLKDSGILVRYFPGPVTGRFVRISIGTGEQTCELVDALRKMF